MLVLLTEIIGPQAYSEQCDESSTVTKPAGRQQGRSASVQLADLIQRGWQRKSESRIQQLTSTMLCHPCLSPLPWSLMPELPQASSPGWASPPEALGCWRTVTTMSACLFFSLTVLFRRRHDRSSATRFNPSGSNSRGTKQQPSHIIILMTASCHEQHQTALMTSTVDLEDTCISHLVASAPLATIWDNGVQ